MTASPYLTAAEKSHVRRAGTSHNRQIHRDTDTHMNLWRNRHTKSLCTYVSEKGTHVLV